jgi:hypothetical protein
MVAKLHTDTHGDTRTSLVGACELNRACACAEDAP